MRLSTCGSLRRRLLERLLPAPLPRCGTGRTKTARFLVTVGFLLALGAHIPDAHAQASKQDLGEQVAASLYDRGMVLFEQGDVANAKKMFSESLERSPDGSRSADALRMLRQCNEKLGIQDLDAGRPDLPSDGPLDPYAEEGGDGPLDPYADPNSGTEGGDGPLDPYGDPMEGGLGTSSGPGPNDKLASKTGRLFIAHGALQGFIAGLAVLGPFEVVEGLDGSEDTGDMRGGAVALGFLGAGVAGYLSHWLADKKSLSETQGNVISSGGLWGMYNGAHLGNLLAGEDSDGNDIYAGMAITGLLGSGIGYWYATNRDPSAGDLAFTNSLSFYGTAGGLLLGVAMDPPRGDAYSLNALAGSALGLGLGYYLEGREPTRRRMLKVDLGAVVGAAAPWILLYPFIGDSNGKGDERLTGLFSAMGLVGGGYFAWRYTADDEKSADDGAAAALDSAPPALVQRSESGHWSLSTPSLRPMALPALLPQRGLSIGSDLVGGHF